MSDHYRTLEISKNATQNEIKAAFRRLAKKYHPDKNTSENAETIFQELNKAYEVLSDPKRKAQYDSRLAKPVGAVDPQRRPVYQKPAEYTRSTIKKGKVFGLVLLMAVIVIPLILIRYSSRYNYDKGLEYYNRGDVPNALVYLDRAIMEFGARKVESSIKAIDICYERGYVTQGIAFAQKGSEYVSNKILKGSFSYLEAIGWERLENFQQADFAYTQALKYGYNSDSVYVHLAMMHGFELGQFNRAIVYFSHLIEVSELTEFLLQRGIVYQKSGMTEEAVSDLDRYIEKYPKNGIGYFFLGISLVEHGNKLKACSMFEKGLELGMEECNAYIRLYCQANQIPMMP